MADDNKQTETGEAPDPSPDLQVEDLPLSDEQEVQLKGGAGEVQTITITGTTGHR